MNWQPIHLPFFSQKNINLIGTLLIISILVSCTPKSTKNDLSENPVKTTYNEVDNADMSAEKAEDDWQLVTPAQAANTNHSPPSQTFGPAPRPKAGAIIGESTINKLNEGINKFNNDADVKHATWGFYAQSLGSGKVIAQFNGEKSLTPASTLKVVTTATALNVLGEGFTFKTQIAFDGYIAKNGVLEGNLYIIGGGDPTLASNKRSIAATYSTVLSDWTNAIKKLGISKVNGYIIGDANYFDEAIGGRKWLWEDIGNYYGVMSSGLNFHENNYALVLSSGSRLGQSATYLRTDPPIPGATVINRVTTGKSGSGDNTYIFSAPYSNIIYAVGTIPPNKKGFVVKGAQPDPALIAANAFREKLIDSGIPVTQTSTTVQHLELLKHPVSNDRKTIYTTKSPTISDIAYWTNKRSNNLFAETLLKMLGKEKYGEGNRKAGLKTVSTFWGMKGLDVDGLLLQDGSGLSPVNRISPKHLVTILRIQSQLPTYNAFFNSLPIAGDNTDAGSLKSFMRGTAAEKKIFAKSGYISNVRAFTGYVKHPSGDVIAFSFMINNYTCSNGKMKRKIQNLLANLVAK